MTGYFECEHIQCGDRATCFTGAGPHCHELIAACDEHIPDYRFCLQCRGHVDGCEQNDGVCFGCKCEVAR